MLLFGIILTVAAGAACMFISPICAVLAIALGAALCGVWAWNLKQRDKKINELNNYLSLVCAGNFDLEIADNCEGELSILRNYLYKVITLLKTQNEMLEKDKTYLADAVADISHQLKTPLTSMTVMADLLKTERDEQKRAEFLSIMSAQTDKISWLITNLLKLSKLDAGMIKLKREKILISSVINQSLAPLSITLELKGITVENTAEDFEFDGDAEWTGEALMNIIKNCAEHTDSGGILTFASKKTTVYNSLFIKDNGCGIDAEDLPHIFERFYHGKNSSQESVGIGLALAKDLLEKEKADIFVKSAVNVGTEFEIRFYKTVV